MEQENPQRYLFEDDGRIPNNPHLPLLVYVGVLVLDSDSTTACRERFKRHGWDGSWVNGVYIFHHYHSNAHEVLGVVRGSADIQFGGEQGAVIHVQAGDAVVIPAGVGHCNLGASSDFRVVGAYPKGQEDYDLCRGNPGERPQVIENIKNVPLPEKDPIHGADGALLDAWQVHA